MVAHTKTEFILFGKLSMHPVSQLANVNCCALLKSSLLTLYDHILGNGVNGGHQLVAGTYTIAVSASWMSLWLSSAIII